MQIVKGVGRVKTTWKSGAIQRNAGVRWFIEGSDGRRVITAGQMYGGGYRTRKAAQAALDELTRTND